jgi:HD-GYP domain-containing protein (c-di-GMP phosphodiesterase class II)
LTGEKIHSGSACFAIVDVWDALISDRPYRPAWTEEAALSYIHENAGILFDANIVNLFESLITKLKKRLS